MKLLFTIDEDAYNRSINIDDDLLLLRIEPTEEIRDIWFGDVELQKLNGDWLLAEADIVLPFVDPEYWPTFSCWLKKVSKADIEIGMMVWAKE